MNTPIYKSRTVQSEIAVFAVALLVIAIPDLEPHRDALLSILGIIAVSFGYRFGFSNSDPA